MSLQHVCSLTVLSFFLQNEVSGGLKLVTRSLCPCKLPRNYRARPLSSSTPISTQLLSRSHLLLSLRLPPSEPQKLYLFSLSVTLPKVNRVFLYGMINLLVPLCSPRILLTLLNLSSDTSDTIPQLISPLFINGLLLLPSRSRFLIQTLSPKRRHRPRTLASDSPCNSTLLPTL